LLAKLESDHYRRGCLAPPDGNWFRRVQEHVAERDGDTELAASLRDRRVREHAEFIAVARAMFSR
jgi:hypothetical protein